MEFCSFQNRPANFLYLSYIRILKIFCAKKCQQTVHFWRFWLFRGTFERKMVNLVVELVNEGGAVGERAREDERLERKCSLCRRLALYFKPL